MRTSVNLKFFSKAKTADILGESNIAINQSIPFDWTSRIAKSIDATPWNLIC